MSTEESTESSTKSSTEIPWDELSDEERYEIYSGKHNWDKLSPYEKEKMKTHLIDIGEIIKDGKHPFKKPSSTDFIFNDKDTALLYYNYLRYYQESYFYRKYLVATVSLHIFLGFTDPFPLSKLSEEDETLSNIHCSLLIQGHSYAEFCSDNQLILVFDIIQRLRCDIEICQYIDFPGTIELPVSFLECFKEIYKRRHLRPLINPFIDEHSHKHTFYLECPKLLKNDNGSLTDKSRHILQQYTLWMHDFNMFMSIRDQKLSHINQITSKWIDKKRKLHEFIEDTEDLIKKLYSKYDKDLIHTLEPENKKENKNDEENEESDEESDENSEE